MKISYQFFASLVILLGCAGMVLLLNNHYLDQQPVTGHGSPETLLRKYQLWKQDYLRQNGPTTLKMPLRYSKAFAEQETTASGTLYINLLQGQLTANLEGLEEHQGYTLWLVGGENNAQQPEKAIKIQEFAASSAQTELAVQLDKQALRDLTIKRMVVTKAEQATPSPAILAASPSLFQRMFFSDQLWTITVVGDRHPLKPELAFGFLLPQPAMAANEALELNQLLGQQIAEGRQLFVNETFNGNGRTCATCHRLDNNHTIDPKYIAKLPQNDPLFVAENVPELKELENSKLLRQFGLILANVDGFDRPGVLRSVPHTLALATSITPEADKEGRYTTHALGWSGDGAPGDGSLRMFAVGAVVQHMPKSLQRIANKDFRLPNDAELDALEAYMLSLGRAQDYDLDKFVFSSPVVQRGRELFHSKDLGTAQCKGCHFNAGANSSTTFQNGNRDTGVENMPENPARLTWKPTPVDGGFGKHERHNCGWDQKQTCYGNGEFNVTTVIEAADTAPFFHNNSVNTIEEAVAFYNSNAFHNSPGANPIDSALIPPRTTCDRCTHLESTQIVSVALFLRTINAMENVRSSNAMLQQTQQLGIKSGTEILMLAIADTEDAIEVLEGGQIIANPESLQLLKAAMDVEKSALDKFFVAERNVLLDKAINLKNRASNLLLSAAPKAS